MSPTRLNRESCRKPGDPLNYVGDVRFKTEILFPRCSTCTLCDSAFGVAQNNDSFGGQRLAQ
jgi:hypothetical protein